MHSCLRECLGHDGRLLEFDAEAEMNDRMKKASVESDKHVVGSVVSSKEILIEHVLPPLLINLGLEELQIIIIISFITEELLEAGGIVKVVNNGPV